MEAEIDYMIAIKRLNISRILISQTTNHEEKINLIKKSYYKLALKHHPDKGGDSKRFKEIKEAYDFIIQVTHLLLHLVVEVRNMRMIGGYGPMELGEAFHVHLGIHCYRVVVDLDSHGLCYIRVVRYILKLRKKYSSSWKLVEARGRKVSWKLVDGRYRGRKVSVL